MYQVTAINFVILGFMAFIIFYEFKLIHQQLQHRKIIRAIAKYSDLKDISFDDLDEMLESIKYQKNFLCWFIDWNIDSNVPREVYDKIKPYL